MPRRRTAVVDFDGTIAAYDGWKGVGVYGEPLPGARATLADLQAAGWEIIVFTSRNWEERVHIEAYLRRHGIPFTQVVCGKPLGAAYIDDRSTGRGGDWATVRRDLGLAPAVFPGAAPAGADRHRVNWCEGVLDAGSAPEE